MYIDWLTSSDGFLVLGGSDILHVSCDLANVVTIQGHKQYNYVMHYVCLKQICTLIEIVLFRIVQCDIFLLQFSSKVITSSNTDKKQLTFMNNIVKNNIRKNVQSKTTE